MLGYLVAGVVIYLGAVKGYAYYLAREEAKAKRKEYEENFVSMKDREEE